LGHYKEGKSSIDSPNFFLSDEGKTNPEKELKASIDLFEKGKDETICLFPARYLFLKKKGLVNRGFPSCDEYEQFKKDLQPSGVTLLFTDAYMNNPSSMFGHTLLRIDTKRKGTQLLAHGANYGAFTGDVTGAMYAILGLTGGYMGGFTVKPYYDIINTYNNIENRDIWELNLDLSEEELELFVAHLWEVGQAQSRYFFFSRNCSYMLLEMLDAVRPGLALADKFPVHVIPLDTFKAVYDAKGLVKDVNYRPSRQNKIRHGLAKMTPEQKQIFYQAIKTKNYDLKDLDDDKKIGILETAYQFVQYQYVANKLELQDYRKQSFGILRERNLLKTIPEKDVQTGKSPLQAHNSMRLALGGGSKDGSFFEEIAYRPAYHSLTDDNYGFLRGAEINFLDVRLRHYEDDDKYVLHRFDLVGIRSVAPVDRLFNPMSFQILADISREKIPDEEKEEGYVANLVVGGGGAYALSDEIWVFAMLNNRVAYSEDLPRNQWGGIGGQAGVLADVGDWRALLEAEKVYASSRAGEKTLFKLEVVHSINRNLAVAGYYEYQQNCGQNTDEVYLGVRSYF